MSVQHEMARAEVIALADDLARGISESIALIADFLADTSDHAGFWQDALTEMQGLLAPAAQELSYMRQLADALRQSTKQLEANEIWIDELRSCVVACTHASVPFLTLVEDAIADSTSSVYAMALAEPVGRLWKAMSAARTARAEWTPSRGYLESLGRRSSH